MPPSILNADTLANPFPLLAQLREAGAVVAIPAPTELAGQFVWIVTAFEEAVLVLKNLRFTVDPSTISFDDGQQPQQSMYGELGAILAQSMIAFDEPDHRRLRSLVSKAFTPRYIESLRPEIQKIADDLIDRVQDRGYMDLVSDYAFPLPINVISKMLGVPSERQLLIHEWSEMLTSARATRQEESASRLLTQAFTEYLLRLIAEKRAHPQNDLISQLVQSEEAGDHLNENELLSMIALLIFAGHETTSNLISNGMLTLFDSPSQFQQLKANLDLVPMAVEELLRYSGPVLSPAPRYATEDVMLGGQMIRKGDMVMILLASANRDESRFTQPAELEIARSLNRHIAFGHGIHSCLGAPLARLEGDIAFTTLLQRLPGIKRATDRDTIMWRGNFSLRGISSLPVTF